jgi:sugar lactone lactonase YvrE
MRREASIARVLSRLLSAAWQRSGAIGVGALSLTPIVMCVALAGCGSDRAAPSVGSPAKSHATTTAETTSSSHTSPVLSPAGTLSIAAGVLGQAGAPSPGPATKSKLSDPSGVAVDRAGNLYIADPQNQVIEKVTPSGVLSVVAGVVGQSGAPAPGAATSSDLDDPVGVAVDGAGNLYVADYDNADVEKVTPAGTLSVVAGDGQSGTPTPGPATSSGLSGPVAVAVDNSGTLYIADGGADGGNNANDVVEKVTPAGVLSIVAGEPGQSGAPSPGPAASSELGGPVGVAVDAAGNLYIADNDAANASTSVIEKVTPSGTLSIVAGVPGQQPSAPTPGPATSSSIGLPGGVAVDSAGDLYIPDLSNSVVYKVTASGTLSVVAGVVTQTGGSPTPGPATSSHLNDPSAVAVNNSGDVYIAGGNSVIEKITP